jgi:HxlR-like helix-turn-helix protein
MLTEGQVARWVEGYVRAWHLGRGTMRFTQLKAEVAGISHKMLAQTLRGLDPRRGGPSFSLGVFSQSVLVASSTSGAPAVTVSPTWTQTVSTTPWRVVRTGFSIFIASTTATTWPAATWSPAATATAVTVPRIGLVRVRPSAPELIAAADAAGTSRRGAAAWPAPPGCAAVGTR